MQISVFCEISVSNPYKRVQPERRRSFVAAGDRDRCTNGDARTISITMQMKASSDTIDIRRAKPEDAPAIALIQHSLGWVRRLESEPVEVTTETVRRHLEMCNAAGSHSVYVACRDIPVGYIAVHWLPYLLLSGPEGFISELFIIEAERGKGVGTRLLDTVQKEAMERGCSRLQLINFRARESYRRQFYTRAGWTERTDAANFVLTL